MRRILLSIITLVAITLIMIPPALAAMPFGNAAFQRLWERQDRAVSEHISARSGTWGPVPLTDVLREPLAEGVDGSRSVQYFDKSRMEINDPTADPNASWYVTNGL